MVTREVTCATCGCVIPSSEAVRNAYPHRCWPRELPVMLAGLASELGDPYASYEEIEQIIRTHMGGEEAK